MLLRDSLRPPTSFIFPRTDSSFSSPSYQVQPPRLFGRNSKRTPPLNTLFTALRGGFYMGLLFYPARP